MTIVKKTNRLLFVLFCLMVTASCKRATKNTESKKNNIVIDTILYDYSNIETNRRNDGYNGRLIHTLPVKEGDTVLFIKYAQEKGSKINMNYKTSSFVIQSFNELSYYKTGTNKFSTYPISLKKIKDKKASTFYIYCNYGKSERPDSPSNMPRLVDIKKINNTLAKFDVYNDNLQDYDIYFKINNNNTLTINKIIIKYNFGIDEEEYYYQLDTLITINNKNKYIDLYKLQDVTEIKKNIRKYNYLNH